tara:strand:+ start:2232 stop:2978 length:747 start_codon:yes stop_codon:yes gene_type:complete
MHPFFEDYSFFGFVHRGGDEEETENTIDAFKYSSDLGFVFIETDVQATKDGHIVIFHDATLKRMAGVNKSIDELTLKEINEIDLLDGGKIPLLSEALETFPDLRFNIDIKTEDALEETIEIIKKMNFLGKTCLASFSSSRLKRIRNLAGPEACISSGQMDIFKMMCQSVGIGLQATMSQCAQIPVKQWGVPVLTKRFIAVAKKQNKFVHVWTIDDKDRMLELIEFGVDGLMTDKPSVLKEAMIERGLF